MDWYFPAYFVLAMFVGASQPKTLGLTISFVVGLLCLYPNTSSAALLVVFYIPFVLYANFRD